MKKLFILLIAAGGALSASAQSANDSDVYKLRYQQSVLQSSRDTLQYRIDSIRTSVEELNRRKRAKMWKTDNMLSRWVLDFNLLGGILTEGITKANTNGNYANGIDLNTGNLKFSNGMSYGADLEIGYFLGKKAHWGIGTGFMYFYQTGDLKLDQFNVQYEAQDANYNTFRQVTKMALYRKS
jgi:hypothetical protein